MGVAVQVAYAWLQGETTSAGSLKDVQNSVCRAVHVVTTCADSTQKSVHLAVIQALLTIATSEHFVPHGATLVQCLKVVFNLAIATEDELVTLTAQNALLQVRCLLMVLCSHTSSGCKCVCFDGIQGFDSPHSVCAPDQQVPVRL